MAAPTASPRGTSRPESRPATGSRAPAEPRFSFALKVSVPRVELRLYRRTRTAADVLQSAPHFEYVVRCEWGPGAPDAVRAWWTNLPQSYTLRRRWGEIVRFHKLVADMAYDSEHGIARIKAKMPELPGTGELDKFLQLVAATGDTKALSRRDAEWKGTGVPGDPWDELDLFHTIYVEKRLRPYFEELSRVMEELPAGMIEASAAFRKFVTSGAKCKLVDRSTLGAARERFCGPSSHQADKEDLAAAVKAMLSKGSVLKSTAIPVVPRAPAGGARREAGVAEPPPLPARAPPPSDGVPPMASSFSAPVLCGGDMSPGGGSPMSPRRTQRVAASHYGFFVRAVKDGGDLGCSSTRDFWKRMAGKQRAELGRRTRLQSGVGDEHVDLRCASLPRLPALGTRPGTAGAASAPREAQAARRGLAKTTGSFAMMSGGAGVSKRETTLRDIAEGLRMTILGDEPPSIERAGRKDQPLADRAPATEDEALSVYRVFRTVLHGPTDGRGFDSSDEDEGVELATVPDGAQQTGLARLRWSALLAWVQQKEDFAEDFRYRSVCASMTRALRSWKQNCMTSEERAAGVHLTQLFRWIWPGVTSEHVAAMLTWICLNEVDKIRHPTPRLIDQDERRRLENIFHNMDFGSKGHCTAEDVAGGKATGVEAKLRNIVDVQTVRAVCGDRSLDEREFMELMCQDDFRAHEGAQQVVLRDGNKLKQQRRETGVTIWVLENPPQWEVPHRRLVDAIEAEIRHWRRLAQSEACPSSCGEADSDGESQAGDGRDRDS